MNFERLPMIESSDILLDIAFRKARQRKDVKKWKGKPIDRAKNKEILKLDIISDYLVERLDKTIKAYPSFEHLPEFYVKLIDLTMSADDLRQALSKLSFAKKKIHSLKRQYVSSIARGEKYDQVKNHQNQFYGRVSSILKQTDPAINTINQCRRTLKTYPDIKPEIFTIALYGFPNIGKTTLLNKMTGTTAKTAAYEFTTKSINVGYLTQDEEDPSKLNPATKSARKKQKKHENALVVQVCDVPGTLARADKMNNIELQAELVIKEITQIIIYLFDLSQEYNIERQLKLYQKITSEQTTPILVHFSKQDIVPEERIKAFQKEHKISSVSPEELTRTILDKAQKFYEQKRIEEELAAQKELEAQETAKRLMLEAQNQE